MLIINVVVQIHPTQGRHQGNKLQFALTRSDGKEGEDTATLEEEKGDVSFVEEERDVERVTVTHKNSDRCENYQRNVRDERCDCRSACGPLCQADIQSQNDQTVTSVDRLHAPEHLMIACTALDARAVASQAKQHDCWSRGKESWLRIYGEPKSFDGLGQKWRQCKFRFLGLRLNYRESHASRARATGTLSKGSWV